jgi:hypothetical protein
VRAGDVEHLGLGVVVFDGGVDGAELVEEPGRVPVVVVAGLCSSGMLISR